MSQGVSPLERQQNVQECIAFLLIKGNTVLAEKRKRTKKVLPGVIALPSGHMEEGESPEGALQREVREELGIVPTDRYYVCTLLHRSQEFRKLHYFAIHHWEGAMTKHEAEALVWVPFDEVETLDLDVDRIALSEYLRLYQALRRQGRTAPPGDAEPMHAALQPGDKVTWWKRMAGGDYVSPVQATVLALTEKRVKIEADDDGEMVIRHVPPQSLQRQG
jgi:8-oxo-dGTP pyrophosphatase MutT (NUDIX family)